MHLKEHEFRVEAFNSGNNHVRAQVGMPRKYGSCHTAIVNGYVIEGHVPAQDIRKLIEEAPNAIGLAVPGMPVGSPGMDGPEYQGRKDPYDVLLVSDDGIVIFNSYNK